MHSKCSKCGLILSGAFRALEISTIQNTVTLTQSPSQICVEYIFPKKWSCA